MTLRLSPNGAIALGDRLQQTLGSIGGLCLILFKSRCETITLCWGYDGMVSLAMSAAGWANDADLTSCERPKKELASKGVGAWEKYRENHLAMLW
jgi:hypothetical protein